jgi:predicted CoA-binding protein
VNPSAESILERKSYASLQAVEGHIDIVDVFRPAKEAVTIVQEAVERKKEKGDIAVIWLQEGIESDEARRLAEENGFVFIEDRCMLKEHKILLSREK